MRLSLKTYLLPFLRVEYLRNVPYELQELHTKMKDPCERWVRTDETFTEKVF